LLAGARGDLQVEIEASWHLLRAGQEDEALDRLVGRAHTLYAQHTKRHVPLLEAALNVALKQGRSKEQCLSLMLPLTMSFYGLGQAHDRYIDQALTWMSELCGLTLATRLRRYVNGNVALLIGMLYGAVRRTFVPKRERLGSLSYMLGYFMMFVVDSTVVTCVRGDGQACRRFVRWAGPVLGAAERERRVDRA
jgi:hypothetical protein